MKASALTRSPTPAILAALLLACPASARAGASAAAAGTEAERVVAQAAKRAGTSGRNVMVVFHASWCRWCHRLEALLADPDVKRAVGGSYEVVWVDVLERSGHTDLETPGGNALLAALGGGEGLPFVAFLSPARATLATSGQIGYPGTTAEIDAFLALLRSTGPHLRAADLDLIRARLSGR